jgi:hypothetical protein
MEPQLGNTFGDSFQVSRIAEPQSVYPGEQARPGLRILESPNPFQKYIRGNDFSHATNCQPWLTPEAGGELGENQMNCRDT